MTENAAEDGGDYDFDIEIKTRAVIRGEALVNITVYLANNHVGAYPIIKVYHVSTVPAETLLGTGTGESHTPGANKFYREAISIDITEKAFNPGEIIRFNVTWECDAFAHRIYHDPASTLTQTDADDARTIGTDITFDCPFRLFS